jgi:hypothetical protein
LAIHAARSLQWHLKWVVFLRRHPLILLFKILALPGYAATTRRYLAHGLLLPRNIGLDTLLLSDFEAIRDQAFILLLLNFDFLMNWAHVLLPSMYLVGSAHGLAPIRL